MFRPNHSNVGASSFQSSPRSSKWPRPPESYYAPPPRHIREENGDFSIVVDQVKFTEGRGLVRIEPAIQPDSTERMPVDTSPAQSSALPHRAVAQNWTQPTAFDNKRIEPVPSDQLHTPHADTTTTKRLIKGHHTLAQINGHVSGPAASSGQRQPSQWNTSGSIVPSLAADTSFSSRSSVVMHTGRRGPTTGVTDPNGHDYNYGSTEIDNAPIHKEVPNKDTRSRRSKAFPKASRPDPAWHQHEEAGVDDIASDIADFDADVNVDKSDWRPKHNLVDSHGNWASPPGDWEGRSMRLDQNKLHQVEAWKEKSQTAFIPHLHKLVENVNLSAELDNHDFWEEQNRSEGKMHIYSRAEDWQVRKTVVTEVAPRSWYTYDIEGVSSDEWFTQHVKDPECIHDSIPWWHRYPTPVDEHLRPLIVPDALLDTADDQAYKAITQTSANAVLEWKGKKSRKAQDEATQRQHRNAAVLNNSRYASNENSFSPRLNVYLRPAEKKDIEQITHIYNHYIKTTISCPEMEPLTAQELEARMADVAEAKLPFLVAVDRSSRAKPRNDPNTAAQHNRGRRLTHENVVGFGFADDYNDIRGMYRYTVELELFTDPDFVKHGVGRILLDKLIHILDTMYLSHGGYDFQTEEEGYSAGGRRTIGCIMIKMPNSDDDSSTLEWKQKWLEQFDFKMMGMLPQIGRKLNQAVNLAIFGRTTALTIQPYAI